MNTNSNPAHPLDLTGQVWINNPVPVFSGNYSSVHTGHIAGSFIQVAIKIIRPVGDYDSVRRKLLREILVWSTTRHANIYPFYGYANNEVFGPFGALVSPWCDKGDASKFLNEHGERMIIAERVKLWQGVLDGVAYLHLCNPPIVHGDLKPGNILIDADGTPRICDFGLARVFFNQAGTGITTTSEYTGTARYLAPELLTEASVPPTFESDVYALGSIGLEFIYLQKPYANHANNLRGQIYRDRRRGLPPAMTQPKLGWPSHRIWPLLLLCWTVNPSSRPSATTIGRSLQCMVLSFPVALLQRIISMSTPAHLEDVQEYYRGWKKTYGNLYNLCLVSRSCHRIAMPILYRDLWLGPDIIPNRISSLLHVLESSKKETPLSHHFPNGYGTFTHILVFYVEGFHTDFQVFSWIQATIPLMPSLRYIRLRVGIPYTWGSILTTSVITVDIYGIRVSFFRRYVPTLLEMTGAQQARIYDLEDESPFPPIEFGPPNPSTPTKAVLLNLHTITLGSMWQTSAAFLFRIMSCWVLPQLSSLDVWDVERTPAEMEGLYDFLRIHGDRLHNFEMSTPLKLKAGFEAMHTSTILGLCRNLHSVCLELPELSFDFSAMSHPHLKVKRIDVDLNDIDYKDYMDDHVASVFLGLKSAVRGVFPNLVDAVMFNKDYEQKMATFRVDENFVSFHSNGYENGPHKYKIYDDGRWVHSPPSSPPLEADGGASQE